MRLAPCAVRPAVGSKFQGPYGKQVEVSHYMPSCRRAVLVVVVCGAWGRGKQDWRCCGGAGHCVQTRRADLDPGELWGRRTVSKKKLKKRRDRMVDVAQQKNPPSPRVEQCWLLVPGGDVSEGRGGKGGILGSSFEGGGKSKQNSFKMSKTATICSRERSVGRGLQACRSAGRTLVRFLLAGCPRSIRPPVERSSC